MRVWIALIVAPMLALADLIISYAAVSAACAHQAPSAVHAAHLLFFVTASACTLVAFRAWREGDAGLDEARTQIHFLAGLAVACAALSAATIAAMWIPAWIISPCLS